MTVEKLIQNAIKECENEGNPVTPTWVMFEAMNAVTDEGLFGMGSDIIDLAEKIIYYVIGYMIENSQFD